MRAMIAAFGVYMGIVGHVDAQIRNIGTQPLGGDPSLVKSAADTVEDRTPYQRALEIFDKLVEARGDFRQPVPKLVLLKGRKPGNAAFMNYQQHEVQLEEVAYNTCVPYGDAAIAFLLAHELTHYYEKHGWRSSFVADYGSLPIAMRLNKLSDKVANETEADYLGGFLAYSAGYGLFEKGPELIQKVYDAYGWGPESDNYPSMADRQAMLLRTRDKLEQLVEVFEMANLLTAVGRYEEAYQFYEYVAIRYQNREIYNNLGVTKVLEALEEFEENELVYRYPIQLDLNFSGSKGAGAGSRREMLLRQALLQFDAALSMDPDYAPAYLNKACTYALIGDTIRARFYADVEARAAALKDEKYAKTAVDADVLLGILEAKNGHTEPAAAIFEAAAKKGSALAGINLKILHDEPLPPAPRERAGLVKETIDSLTILDISHPKDNDYCMKFDPDKSIEMTDLLNFHQNPSPGPGSKVYICQHDMDSAEPFSIFHFTLPGYSGKTAKKIALGDNRDAIVRAYGESPRTIETPMGQIMVYKAIIFILKDDQVVRWINYTTRKSCQFNNE